MSKLIFVIFKFIYKLLSFNYTSAYPYYGSTPTQIPSCPSYPKHTEPSENPHLNLKNAENCLHGSSSYSPHR